jgi:hypothetical protein
MSAFFLQFADLDMSYGYYLRVQSTDGLVFKQTASLSSDFKYFSIFMQTDKVYYKPRDTVRFRTLIVDKNSKPIETKKNITITIIDPKNNRVKQWQQAKLTTGVYKNEYKLSSEPTFGSWNIEVQFEDHTNLRSFEVMKYVLPKVEIIISSPIRNTFQNGKLIFQIEGKYTYGKGMKGFATVNLIYNNGYSNNRPKNFLRKILTIDGKTMVEFDINKDLGIPKYNQFTQGISVNVTVQDELTGKFYSAARTIAIYNVTPTVKPTVVDNVKEKPISFNVDGYESNFKPGMWKEDAS